MDKLDMVRWLKERKDNYPNPGKYIDPNNRNLFILAIIAILCAIILALHY